MPSLATAARHFAEPTTSRPCVGFRIAVTGAQPPRRAAPHPPSGGAPATPEGGFDCVSSCATLFLLLLVRVLAGRPLIRPSGAGCSP